jgi:hypothetical protein
MPTFRPFLRMRRLVALCERRGIETLATLDRHFDVYRTTARRRLKNVFRAR